MPCPICDQKPMNCDCTPRERAMWREMQELQDEESTVLTPEERKALRSAIADYEQNDDDEDCARMVVTLRGLLKRTERRS